MKKNFEFYGGISEEVLCNYLNRAVTISCEPGHELSPIKTPEVRSFILNTGAKYICRAATRWIPAASDYATYPDQKAFIEWVHKDDPDVIFEACIFECVTDQVGEIPVPAWVFEAFGLESEERCFSIDAMRFPDGTFTNQWGQGTAVPDMTQIETQMFFFYRACEYINLGYEGLHMGQIHLIGKNDEGWVCWTRVLDLVREYAKTHARRAFVLINAHTPGMLDANGKLMFDFHMFPIRPVADDSQPPHFPTEDDPQRATLNVNHRSGIFGRSLGGLTHSGWETDTLPYCVELDNYFDDLPERLHVPRPDLSTCWGMDEINWFAHQPAWYREEFLRYAYAWVRDVAPGKCYFAMPGQRVIRLRNEQGEIICKLYRAYDQSTHPEGFGDESVIKDIWSE